MEEVALVLAAVDAAQQPAALADARVVAGCESLRAEASRVVEADTELDFAIARDDRIGRAAGFELGEEMREHALAVFRCEARLVNRDSQFFGDAPRVLEILGSRAIALVVLDPVRHEEGFDLVACIHEKRGRDCGVHATGESDDNASHVSARDLAHRSEVLRHMVQHFDRIARAAEVIIHAELDQRASMLAGPGAKLLPVEPQGADDGAIQFRLRRALANPTRERDAEYRPADGPLPEIEARDVIRQVFPPSLFPSLANHGFEE